MKQIVLTLSPELHDALQHLAGRDETAFEDILNDALRNDLRRRIDARAAHNMATLAPLRAMLGDDLADATDWYDLQERLQALGYQVRRCGGGLSLQDLSGTHICSCADLGYSHTRLTRRFGRPIPPVAAHMKMAS